MPWQKITILALIATLVIAGCSNQKEMEEQRVLAQRCDPDIALRMDFQHDSARELLAEALITVDGGGMPHALGYLNMMVVDDDGRLIVPYHVSQQLTDFDPEFEQKTLQALEQYFGKYFVFVPATDDDVLLNLQAGNDVNSLAYASGHGDISFNLAFPHFMEFYRNDALFRYVVGHEYAHQVIGDGHPNTIPVGIHGQRSDAGNRALPYGYHLTYGIEDGVQASDPVFNETILNGVAQGPGDTHAERLRNAPAPPLETLGPTDEIALQKLIGLTRARCDALSQSTGRGISR